MGSIHHLTRYISKPSKEASALKPLLKTLDKDKTLDWKSDHTTAFYRILKLVSEITENKQFDQNLETRVVCDASKLEWSAALEHFTQIGRVAISYVSRFIKFLEKKYSLDELELSGVLRETENFKFYLYEKNSTIITDHQALISS